MKNFSPIAWHTDHVIQALEISETPRVFPRVFSGISTDSRIITDEDLFVALQGDTFDGHQFIFPLQFLGHDLGQLGPRHLLAVHRHHAAAVAVSGGRSVLRLRHPQIGPQ